MYKLLLILLLLSLGCAKDPNINLNRIRDTKWISHCVSDKSTLINTSSAFDTTKCKLDHEHRDTFYFKANQVFHLLSTNTYDIYNLDHHFNFYTYYWKYEEEVSRIDLFNTTDTLRLKIAALEDDRLVIESIDYYLYYTKLK